MYTILIINPDDDDDDFGALVNLTRPLSEL